MARFELYKSKNGEYRFRLKAGNGQTILASEGYKTRAAAKNGIASVQKNVARTGGVEFFSGRNKKHYFRIKASNGQTVASSQGYASKSGARRGVGSVQQNASAEVRDLTA